jgi:hypothetical protein
MEIMVVAEWRSRGCALILESLGQFRKSKRPEQPSNSGREEYSSFDPAGAMPTSNPNPHILSSTSPNPTVSELRDKYLAWLDKHRSTGLHREAKRHIGRWCDEHGFQSALDVEGSHLEAFQDQLIACGHAPLYVKKHSTSVRALFNKAVRMGQEDCKVFIRGLQ